MSYAREAELDFSFPRFAALRVLFGFIPNLFGAQALVPPLIEAESQFLSALMSAKKTLPRTQKERLMLSVAAADGNAYCVALHYQTLLLLGVPEEQVQQIITNYQEANLSVADAALLKFVIKLTSALAAVGREEVDECFSSGCTDRAMLEAVAAAAWAKFACTIAIGLGVVPDFEPPEIAARPFSFLTTATNSNEHLESSAAYLRTIQAGSSDFPLLSSLREEFGFVPRVFLIQTLRPDLVHPELRLIRSVLATEDLLTRPQKHCILLAVAAATRNAYWIAALIETLRAAGMSEHAEQIALDYRQASLSSADKALLDFACKLAVNPLAFRREDIDALRSYGFSEEQILEGVATTALGNFLQVLQRGLCVEPDFPPSRIFAPDFSKTVHFSIPDSHPTQRRMGPDPDAESVARVQSGDLDAFEELIHRHSRRVYRTLVGVLGDREEARDAMQETFLKAFEHLGDFQGRAKFSTWLVSIATNTALQMVRERRPQHRISNDIFEEGFRPMEIRAWGDDPEQLYSKAEMRELVEENVMKLPAKYRLVLLLREIEQLPMEEAATALGLTLAAFKARLLRGRLMLREALASHFTVAVKESMT